MRQRSGRIVIGALTITVMGCAPSQPSLMRKPAEEYAARIKSEAAISGLRQSAGRQSFSSPASITAALRRGRPQMSGVSPDYRASMRLVSGDSAEMQEDFSDSVVTNLGESTVSDDRVDEILRQAQRLANSRDYVGPLDLGDPGVSASLWKESRGANDLFRDYRASQAMDLITIVVNESTSGKSEGTTDITQESSFSAAIRNLLGLEDWNQLDVFDSAGGAGVTPSGADLSNLVRASATSEFSGDGETERKGRLTGKISAMIAEVLPSGVMRIEGEKIISLNNEEEIMVISGLIRPEDVNSNNEVQSSKIANVRIDYYGNGTVGDAQRGGWLGRFLRRWWPL